MNLQTIKTSVQAFIKDENGLTIVEYAVAGGNVKDAITSLGCAVKGTTC